MEERKEGKKVSPFSTPYFLPLAIFCTEQPLISSFVQLFASPFLCFDTLPNALVPIQSLFLDLIVLPSKKPIVTRKTYSIRFSSTYEAGYMDVEQLSKPFNNSASQRVKPYQTSTNTSHRHSSPSQSIDTRLASIIPSMNKVGSLPFSHLAVCFCLQTSNGSKNDREQTPKNKLNTNTKRPRCGGRACILVKSKSSKKNGES
ncbi:MAG: hypothetical protein JOS17DRAFT_394224 [Linnemannia elongata]|nr:MAG: hypothetical protein JOS17DRAFT_394224 [Linnemannia elongata]